MTLLIVSIAHVNWRRTSHPSIVFFDLPKKYIKIYFYLKRFWPFRLEKLIEIQFIWNKLLFIRFLELKN